MGVDDRSRMIRITRPLPAGFSPEWARNVLVRHHSRLDPDWLLGSVLKVLEVK